MGTFFSPVNGCVAYVPKKTPLFVFCNSVRSKSDLFAASLTYFCTTSLFSSVVNWSNIGCSGATTKYVAPYKVSGLVVYTSKNEESSSETGNFNCAPSLLPIQLRCISLMDSGQSKSSKSSNNRSANFVIFSIHCFIGLRITG